MIILVAFLLKNVWTKFFWRKNLITIEKKFRSFSVIFGQLTGWPDLTWPDRRVGHWSGQSFLNDRDFRSGQVRSSGQKTRSGKHWCVLFAFLVHINILIFLLHFFVPNLGITDLQGQLKIFYQYLKKFGFLMMLFSNFIEIWIIFWSKNGSVSTLPISYFMKQW